MVLNIITKNKPLSRGINMHSNSRNGVLSQTLLGNNKDKDKDKISAEEETVTEETAAKEEATVKENTETIPPFNKDKRIHLRQDASYKGPLSQGSRVFSLSPYSLGNTCRYMGGLLFGDSVAINECKDDAPIGKLTRDHCVGVLSGKLNAPAASNIEESSSSSSQAEDPFRILFVGDLMVSASGNSIHLKDNLLEKISKAHALVVNVEAPVTFEEGNNGREGISFAMTKTYLQEFVEQVKAMNPEIKLIFDIANNHALDRNKHQPLTSQEKELEDIDAENFSLMRTVAAIKSIAPESHIVGAWLHESKYADKEVNTLPWTIIGKPGLRIGIWGFTDVLNHNAHHFDKRVCRTEDIFTNLEQFKEDNNLDYLYLVGHGNLEQCMYPLREWREGAIKFLQDGADGIIGHGPHIPNTSEVIKINGKEKLIVHSLGNFFGPKKLSNTGYNSLLEINVTKQTSQFAIQPIEASVVAGVPYVDMAPEEGTRYPALARRFNTLYPIANYQDRLSEFERNLKELDDKINLCSNEVLKTSFDELISQIKILNEKGVDAALVNHIVKSASALIDNPDRQNTKLFLNLAKEADSKRDDAMPVWKKAASIMFKITGTILTCASVLSANLVLLCAGLGLFAKGKMWQKSRVANRQPVTKAAKKIVKNYTL